MISEDQQEVCSEYSVDPVDCDSVLQVGIAFSTIGQLPLNALRHPPTATTTGWYIWGGQLSANPEFFDPMHASHLEERVPEPVRYLALPPGWRVLLAPGQVDAWFDPSLTEVE